MDAVHDDGSMEPDGIFGNPLKDLLKHAGNYTFMLLLPTEMDAPAAASLAGRCMQKQVLTEGKL
ncbi:MAG: hypothetical protein WDO19_30240 [Bacteroidota bacterium]